MPVRCQKRGKSFTTNGTKVHEGKVPLLGLCGGASVAGARGGSPNVCVEMDAFKGTVDHGIELARIFHFAAFGKAALGFFGTHPTGAAIALIGSTHLENLHQEGLDHEFLHAAGLPEHTLAMQKKMEVAGFNHSNGAGFLRRFALGSL